MHWSIWLIWLNTKLHNPTETTQVSLFYTALLINILEYYPLFREEFPFFAVGYYDWFLSNCFCNHTFCSTNQDSIFDIWANTATNFHEGYWITNKWSTPPRHIFCSLALTKYCIFPAAANVTHQFRRLGLKEFCKPARWEK